MEGGSRGREMEASPMREKLTFVYQVIIIWEHFSLSYTHVFPRNRSPRLKSDLTKTNDT